MTDHHDEKPFALWVILEGGLGSARRGRQGREGEPAPRRAGPSRRRVPQGPRKALTAPGRRTRPWPHPRIAPFRPMPAAQAARTRLRTNPAHLPFPWLGGQFSIRCPSPRDKSPNSVHGVGQRDFPPPPITFAPIEFTNNAIAFESTQDVAAAPYTEARPGVRTASRDKAIGAGTRCFSSPRRRP